MIKAVSTEDTELVLKVKELIQEYALSLGFDLAFQDFEEEMETFPTQYSEPYGRLLVAEDEDEIIGCVGLRNLGDGICEMKRLYVKPEFQGKGTGRALVQAIIKEACEIGYTTIRLDTIPAMNAAINLYLSSGFRETTPYRYNPISGARYFELKLE